MKSTMKVLLITRECRYSRKFRPRRRPRSSHMFGGGDMMILWRDKGDGVSRG